MGGVQMAETVGIEEPELDLGGVLAGCSIELLPDPGLDLGPLASALAPGSRVFLAFAARTQPAVLVETARRVGALGFVPVPHLPARRFADARSFAGLLEALASCGVREALVIAGDPARPAGPYASALALMETGLFQALGFGRLFVAGHPEGHPRVAVPELERALRAKCAVAERAGIALEVVTQFGFDADAPLRFERRLRELGVEVPIRVGLAGPARLATLLRYAARCGVASSAAVALREPGRVVGMMARRTPDAQLRVLLRHRSRCPGCRLHAVHLFPFGGVRETLDWLARIQGAGGERRPL